MNWDNHFKYEVAPPSLLYLRSNTVELSSDSQYGLSWRVRWRNLVDCYRKGVGVKLKSAICVHSQLMNLLFLVYGSSVTQGRFLPSE